MTNSIHGGVWKGVLPRVWSKEGYTNTSIYGHDTPVVWRGESLMCLCVVVLAISLFYYSSVCLVIH